MKKQVIEKFLVQARSKTYAANMGKTTEMLPGSKQLEYCEGEYLYRDVYFIGNKIFPGLETVYFQGKPVWSMSYFGIFTELTEVQVDSLLRKALLENWRDVRLYKHVEKEYEGCKYICEGDGSFEEIGGTEEIYIDGDRKYYLYYAGGLIG